MSERSGTLAIDTASPAGAVAVACGNRVFEEILPHERRASEELLNAVARCLERADLTLVGVARIAVCAGPGSFTGIRVGLAAAWGLSRASGIPVETVSTLEAMAEAARGLGADPIWTALDAGRGEIVCQAFDLGGPRAEARGESVRIPRDRLAETAAGVHVVALPHALGEPASPILPCTPAFALAAAAANAPRAGTSVFAPIYSRPSAAEERHGPA